MNVQTSAIELASVETPLPSPFRITENGLAIEGRPSLDEWIAFGRTLYRMRSALQWTIGDWILYGESREDWRDRYDQAVSMFDYPYDYLYNLTSIARKFPSHARVSSLSWSHHQAVGALPEPERKRVLKQAAKQHLPRDDVRAIVKDIKAKLNPPAPVDLTPPPLPIAEPVSVPQFQPPPAPAPVSGAPVVTAAACRIMGTHGRQVFFEFEDETIVQQLWKLWQSEKGKDLVLTLTRKENR